jgi:uncharacterized protein
LVLGRTGDALLFSAAMPPIPTVLLFILAVFVGGALLSPWLHWLLQWAARDLPGLKNLARQPFDRFVLRGMLAVAAAGVWPFLRALGARSWAEAGIVQPAGQWRRLAFGFGLGSVSIACTATLALAGGARAFYGGFEGRWWGRLPEIATAAVGIAVVEELLFRGVLFTALRRAHGWKTALFGSSAIYAMLHFFQKVEPPESVTWLSGLMLLPQMMKGFVEPGLIVPGFLSLSLAGMMLGLAFQRTGNLWFSIGLHAGWVFWLKCNTLATDVRPGAALWFWGTSKLFDGWPGVLVLAAAALAVWKLPLQKPIDHDES